MQTIKDKEIKDLHQELESTRKDLFSFRTAVAGGKTKNVKEGRNLRKQIARIMTELTVRRTSAAK